MRSTKQSCGPSTLGPSTSGSSSGRCRGPTGPPATSPCPRWPSSHELRRDNEVFVVRAHGALGRAGQSPAAVRGPDRADADGRGRRLQHGVDRRAPRMEYTISPSPMPLLAYLAGADVDDPPGRRHHHRAVLEPHPGGGRVRAARRDQQRPHGGRARPGRLPVRVRPDAGGLPAADGGKHLRELVPAVRELWQGDYAHDGEIWQFPTSTSVPKPVQQPNPPMWVAARDPASHDFAVGTGCNVMVTPLMKGDEEVVDLKRKFDTAVANHPEVPRPELMVLRHTHVHAADDPDGLAACRRGDLAVLPHLRRMVRQQDHARERFPRRRARVEVRRTARSSSSNHCTGQR